MGHVVGVTGRDRFPGVPAWVGCRNPERGHQPVLAVGPMVGEGLAGPFAGNQDAATGVTEVLAAVRLAFAPAGPQPRSWVLGLDAVAKPVRTGRGNSILGVW